MTERRIEISKGASKHIAKDLKPEARKVLSEEEAWESTEQILRMRIEGYSGHFPKFYFMIRDFHKIRWEMKVRMGTSREVTNKELTIRLSEFVNKYSEEALDEAKDIFGIITQIYSR